jgi:predicted amidohydrolase
VVDGAPIANHQVLAAHLDRNPGADLYLVPELWTSGYVQQEWGRLAAEYTPASLDWMAEQARSRGIWLGGSLIAANSDKSLANRFVLFDRSGHLVCEYDKSHLFRPLQEDVYLRSSHELPPIIEAEGHRLAPAICYDLRFPEMFRNLALLGVDVFLVSSEWPHPRERALRILAEARAIENQAALVLSNRVGKDSHGYEFCGGSAVFGPLGLLVEAGPGSNTIDAQIDANEIADLRTSFPVISHRLQGIDYV